MNQTRSIKARKTLQCTKCHVIQPIDQFTWLEKKRRYHSHCRICKNRARHVRYWRNPEQIRRQIYEARRRRGKGYQEQITRIKNIPCVDCRRRFPAVAMDFDHRPGTKKFECVSRMINRALPWSKIKLEIAKCDIVCSNCHRIRTWIKRRKLK